MSYSAKELISLLNNQDECAWIEAKTASESSRSMMESVCAFANEPDLGGGYLLLGVAPDEGSLFPQYIVKGVPDPDKMQSDIATQSASSFNIPIRPEIKVQEVNGKYVLVVYVAELPPRQKPVYFKKEGLPGGAYRRIGPTDQRCTEDDMHVFYQSVESYDQSAIQGSTLNDIDENALSRYRSLREKVNPAAEELTYSDADLLQALGCVNRSNSQELNMAGLVLFGKSMAQRRFLPMLRVDYIRVPGNQWVEDPDERFTTIDMRGPLLLMVYRLVDAINADLPRGFLLSEGDVQATTTGLPVKALREAIVNALMHRSYRENRPIQIIRYDNRIEIKNPGFSLKPEENLGDPGSETRNPFIAAVFHDTNLAETKGSGIRAMRRLLQHAQLAPPTFESSRENNEFTARLLLHHFLNEEDIVWLSQFDSFNLTDAQKQALIFIREVGAIDNLTYRQMADYDTLKASSELRNLKQVGLLEQKGKAKATYYIPGKLLEDAINDLTGALSDGSGALSEITSALSDGTSAVKDGSGALIKDKLVNELTDDLKDQLKEIGDRERDPEKINSFIRKVCSIRAYSISELSSLLDKTEKYISRTYTKQMLESGELAYLYPEMPNHPKQAYVTPKNKVD